jgi:hypothetical protein
MTYAYTCNHCHQTVEFDESHYCPDIQGIVVDLLISKEVYIAKEKEEN